MRKGEGDRNKRFLKWSVWFVHGWICHIDTSIRWKERNNLIFTLAVHTHRWWSLTFHFFRLINVEKKIILFAVLSASESSSLISTLFIYQKQQIPLATETDMLVDCAMYFFSACQQKEFITAKSKGALVNSRLSKDKEAMMIDCLSLVNQCWCLPLPLSPLYLLKSEGWLIRMNRIAEYFTLFFYWISKIVSSHAEKIRTEQKNSPYPIIFSGRVEIGIESESAHKLGTRRNLLKAYLNLFSRAYDQSAFDSS